MADLRSETPGQCFDSKQVSLRFVHVWWRWLLSLLFWLSLAWQWVWRVEVHKSGMGLLDWQDNTGQIKVVSSSSSKPSISLWRFSLQYNIMIGGLMDKAWKLIVHCAPLLLGSKTLSQTLPSLNLPEVFPFDAAAKTPTGFGAAKNCSRRYKGSLSSGCLKSSVIPDIASNLEPKKLITWCLKIILELTSSLQRINGLSTKEQAPSSARKQKAPPQYGAKDSIDDGSEELLFLSCSLPCPKSEVSPSNQAL